MRSCVRAVALASLLTLLVADRAGAQDAAAKAAFDRGVTKSQSGDAAGAVADFSEAIRRHPTFVEAFALRGLARAPLAQASDGRP